MVVGRLRRGNGGVLLGDSEGNQADQTNGTARETEGEGMCDTICYEDDEGTYHEIYTCGEYADKLGCDLDGLVMITIGCDTPEDDECMCWVDIEESAEKHGMTASEIPDNLGHYELIP